MYVDTPTGYPRDDGDFPVRTNPGNSNDPFAIIDLNETGTLSLRLDSLADADRLLRAAGTARAKLKAYLSGAPHAFKEEEEADWRGQCVTCGATASSPIHQEPEPYGPCGEVIGDDGGHTVYTCAKTRGHEHDGIPHDDPPAGPPAAHLCGARRPEDADDGTACVLLAGHDGGHVVGAPYGPPSAAEVYAAHHPQGRQS